MPIDPLPVWYNEYEKLPMDSTGLLSPKNLGKFIADRVNNKLSTQPSVVEFTPVPLFTWQSSIFISAIQLLSKTPSFETVTPAMQIASAWQSATQASTFIIQPGANYKPPLPPTNSIASTAQVIINPASITIGYSIIVNGLSSAPMAFKRSQAAFPRVIREAFMSIKLDITGTDTSVPPAGPYPILYPMTPVI